LKGRNHHTLQKAGHETSAVERGIKERRRKVENDDEPTVCDVDTIPKEQISHKNHNKSERKRTHTHTEAHQSTVESSWVPCHREGILKLKRDPTAQMRETRHHTNTPSVGQFSPQQMRQ
jgi:hypothetical protein